MTPSAASSISARWGSVTSSTEGSVEVDVDLTKHPVLSGPLLAPGPLYRAPSAAKGHHLGALLPFTARFATVVP